MATDSERPGHFQLLHISRARDEAAPREANTETSGYDLFWSEKNVPEKFV